MGELTAKDLKYLRWAVDGALLFSTCGRAKYMAIITDVHGVVVSTGYNGGPHGWPHCEDGACPRFKAGDAAHGGDYLDCISIHAEINSLLHGDQSRYRGGTLYVNGVPCFACAKAISNSGICRVIYLEDDHQRELPAVRQFLGDCDVELIACGEGWW